MANIIRSSKNENPYVQIDKRPLEDVRLSWEAKGLHAYIMSKPNNWTINVKHLIKQSRNGRDATYRIIRELIEAGYIERIQERDESGRMGEFNYVVHETPLHYDSIDMNKVLLKKQPDSPHTEKPDTVNSPHTEKPDTVKPYISNNDFNNNDFKRDDDDDVRSTLFSEFVENGLMTEAEFDKKFVKIAAYKKSNKLAYGRVSMLNAVTEAQEARTIVLKQIVEAKQQQLATIEIRPLTGGHKRNQKSAKPTIDIIGDVSTAAVTLEELEKMRELARKLDDSNSRND